MGLGSWKMKCAKSNNTFQTSGNSDLPGCGQNKNNAFVGGSFQLFFTDLDFYGFVASVSPGARKRGAMLKIKTRKW